MSRVILTCYNCRDIVVQDLNDMNFFISSSNFENKTPSKTSDSAEMKYEFYFLLNYQHYYSSIGTYGHQTAIICSEMILEEKFIKVCTTFFSSFCSSISEIMIFFQTVSCITLMKIEKVWSIF